MSTIKEAAKKRAAAATDAQRDELRTALLEEKRGYVTRGLTDRAKQVDAQLKKLGGEQASGSGQGEPTGSAQARAAAKKAAEDAAAKKAAEDAAAKKAAEDAAAAAAAAGAQS